jgi:hypothetical protein|tara:strand:+ start:2370 stop:2474 length:105 start_codon:yes stop_codon:yes gene_type:complete
MGTVKSYKNKDKNIQKLKEFLKKGYITKKEKKYY